MPRRPRSALPVPGFAPSRRFGQADVAGRVSAHCADDYAIAQRQPDLHPGNTVSEGQLVHVQMNVRARRALRDI